MAKKLASLNTDMKIRLGKFVPIFSRAAGFATSDISWHGVTPITCLHHRMRKSFALCNIATPIELFANVTRRLIRAAKRNVKNLSNTSSESLYILGK
jgi:hypothetical protein